MQDRWLIALDLDGTLFHTNHQISVRTTSALHRVVKLGHQLVILTGRSSHSSVPRLLCLPEGTPIICSNGAYEYDQEKDEILWTSSLPASKAVDIKHTILRQLPTASFGWESTIGIFYEQKFIDEAGGAHTLEQGGHHVPLDQADLLKLYIRTPELRGGVLARTLKNTFGSEVEVSSSGVPFVEMTAAGTNKGAALARVASKLGFESSRTIAFGDNLNDITMLQWAAESVAMGNAAPEVKAIASAHAKSNSDDGVARFLESRFLED